MAAERLLLRAHEGHAMFDGAALHSFETSAEPLRPRNPVVADAPLFVARGIVGASPELTSQVEVLDPPRRERAGECLPVEVGVETAPRRRANVDESRDPMTLQQPQEGLLRMVGMPES